MWKKIILDLGMPRFVRLHPPCTQSLSLSSQELPELKYITEVTLMDDRNHGFSFKVGRNWNEPQLVCICFISLLN